MLFIDYCLQKMTVADLAPAKPIQLIADGSIHRYQVGEDKSGTLNGWYVLHDDSVLICGSWKTDQRLVVHNQNHDDFSVEDRGARKRKITEAQAVSERKKRDLYNRIAKRVQKEWDNAEPADLLHPYLLSKQVPPYGIRQKGDVLLIPLRDAKGKLWSLQYIKADGSKRFAKGGRVKGLFHLLGSIDDRVYFAEGYATAATLHKHCGTTIAVAFNAGNLRNAARELLTLHRDIELVFAADNDRHTKGNPGLTKAMGAAEALGGSVIWPDFPDGVEGTDYCDLLLNGGAVHG